jgi:thioredoxin reductase (NADPH)
MSSTAHSLLQTRREQAFPTLDAADIERLRRFGEPRHYDAGSLVVQAGVRTEGLLVVISGEIAMLAHDSSDPPIVTHQAG